VSLVDVGDSDCLGRSPDPLGQFLSVDCKRSVRVENEKQKNKDCNIDECECIRLAIAGTILPWSGEGNCYHVCEEQVEKESLIKDCAYVAFVSSGSLKIRVKDKK